LATGNGFPALLQAIASLQVFLGFTRHRSDLPLSQWQQTSISSDVQDAIATIATASQQPTRKRL
jgi:hypothetical protein